MSSTIDINGKKLLPIKEAISVVGYSRDYLTRLARGRKIVATQIGRKWYIDIDSLKNYHSATQAEQEIKKRRLSNQRKKDLAIKAMKEEKRQAAKKRLRRKTPSVVVLSAIVALGFGMGAWLESNVKDGLTDFSQLANVRIGLPESEPGYLTVAEIKELQDSSQTHELTPDFSPNASYKNLEATSGLLLLPFGTTSAVGVEEYFSDPVITVVDEAGNTSVVRTDENGNPSGEEIPFIVVPINSNSP